MKYARKIPVGAEYRLQDVVDILPQHQGDPLTFLAKQFPGLTGWFLLQQDVGNGAVEQQNGSFVQPVIPPPAPPPLKPIVATLPQIMEHLGNVLGGVARRGELRKSLEASTDAVVIDALSLLKTPGQTFTKTQAKAFLQMARNKNLPSADTTPGNDARKIESVEVTASDALWPEA